jgi:hypothetical protein
LAWLPFDLGSMGPGDTRAVGRRGAGVVAGLGFGGAEGLGLGGEGAGVVLALLSLADEEWGASLFCWQEGWLIGCEGVLRGVRGG